jgi:hypothetical protein
VRFARHQLWLIVLLLAAGCVDLTAPAELTARGSDGAADEAGALADGPAAPDARPGDGRAPLDGGSDQPPVPFDAGADSALLPPDTMVIGVDAALPPDSTTGFALGTPCAQGTQCASGVCVEGVCCENACGLECRSCKVPGREGTCAPASSGTVCAPGSCSGSTESSARTCDGQGTCQPASRRSCGAYLCTANGCSTSCSGSSDCNSGYGCSAGSCVVPTAPDAGPDASPDSSPDIAPPAIDAAPGGLLVDDFQDSTINQNLIGGEVTWDNAVATLVSGEQKLVWNNQGTYMDFVESLRANWCEYNLTAYTKVRFRMRASAVNKRVEVLLLIGNGSCSLSFDNRVSTVTVGTSMVTYDVDISRTTRDKVLAIELAPTTIDGTEYYVDDIRLVP